MKKFLLVLSIVSTSIYANLRYDAQTDTFYCVNKWIFYKVDQQEYDRLLKYVHSQCSGAINPAAASIFMLTAIGTDTAKQLIRDLKKIIKISKNAVK